MEPYFQSVYGVLVQPAPSRMLRGTRRAWVWGVGGRPGGEREKKIEC